MEREGAKGVGDGRGLGEWDGEEGAERWRGGEERRVLGGGEQMQMRVRHGNTNTMSTNKATRHGAGGWDNSAGETGGRASLALIDTCI